MSSKLSGYVSDIINKGDKGSNLLRAITAETLEYNHRVDVVGEKNKKAVIREKSDDLVVVHSAGGNPDADNIGEHAKSMVENLLKQADRIDATPVGFANVIDSYDGSREMIEEIGNAMVEVAKENGLAIMNGENAILGARINPDYKANLSGTMISLADKRDIREKRLNWTPVDLNAVNFEVDGNKYSAFRHLGHPIFINSDGVGTKTEFYERLGKYAYAVQDFMAMNLDDAIKSGAWPKVVSGIVETRGEMPLENIVAHAERVIPTGIKAILQQEKVGERLNGHSTARSAYNISGSVVSLINEELLNNPPKPKEGNYLIALKITQNPRSNGITARREFMSEKYGTEWHARDDLDAHKKYLTTPSEILYGTFREMLDVSLATSFYHMSGGAFRGKLSEPIADEGLFVKVNNLFEPHKVDIEMMEKVDNKTVENAYGTWPMGNDGFITTDELEASLRVLESRGYQARTVGQLEKRRDVKGAYIQTPLGVDVDFTMDKVV